MQSSAIGLAKMHSYIVDYSKSSSFWITQFNFYNCIYSREHSSGM